MTAHRAIEILVRQKNKLSDIQGVADYTWLTQTSSYVGLFFSKESPQYKFISGYRFGIYAEVKHSVPEFERFINNCIEYIEDNGIYKPDKTNFLFRLDYRWVLGSLTAVLIFTATASYKIGQALYRSELHNENQKLRDSLNRFTIDPTFKVADKVPGEDTGTTKDNYVPKDTNQ